jgi:phage terminase large subunit
MEENYILDEQTSLKASPIFYATIGCNARGIIHQGGQASGKTVNILIALAVRAATEKDVVITVTAKSLPNLKRGAMRDFERLVYPYFKHHIRTHNKTDNIYMFRSGSMIEFKSFESEQDARGAKRDYLYVNEANSFDYLTFTQLHSRTTIQSIIDYNPSAPFWAHANLHKDPNWQLFISDHRHNPFLPDSKHREIESFKGEMFRVYARGLTGNIEGVIFPDWKLVSQTEMPTGDDFIFGVDYGYTNDPTALVKVWIIGSQVYVEELAYQPAITSLQLKEMLFLNGYTDKTPLYSEHDTLMISELRRLGVRNIVMANKKPGSVLNGIRKLKEYNVHYSENSVGLYDELKKYQWLTDDEGKTINKPVDAYNHTIDAVRYAVYTHFFR